MAPLSNSAAFPQTLGRLEYNQLISKYRTGDMISAGIIVDPSSEFGLLASPILGTLSTID